MKERHLLLFCLLVAGLAAAAAPAPPPTRAALMDFSTDDNSWRNAQTAANFTSLLQVELANTPGVEWIERAQLDLARQELKLSDMERIGGASPIRRGKWAKADWLVTGEFSLDDKSQRTLSLEITDLKHADVLASRTVILPGNQPVQIQPVPAQVGFAAGAVRQLLAEAGRREAAGAQVLIAPLFVVDLSSFGLSHGLEGLQQGFYDALERAAATNGHARVIRFPKAYRAMGESEMVLDGLVEADPQAWQQTADLYVWGTYAVTNVHTGAGFQRRLEFTLNLWDGASPLHTFREKTPMTFREGLPPEAAVAMLDRVVSQVMALARRSAPAKDSIATRRSIAESIAGAYRRFAGPMPAQLGLHDQAKFVEAVHMLETACFFDPDNADLQAMRITCRWGWWMDFGFTLKNRFWSHWRRSRAWGQYVDRFGLASTTTPLPFPYQMQGIPGIYVRSLEETLQLFPEQFEPGDEEPQPPGVHTALMEARYHGFPRDIPREVGLKWKAEVEAELAQRKKKAAAYAESTATNSPSMAASANLAQAPQHPMPTPSPGAAKPVRQAPPLGRPSVALPAWFKEINPLFSLFKLSPPSVLPLAAKPVAQEFEFPPQFDVKAVRQMALWRGKLLILAMDERSAPSSEATPDLSAERLSKRGRLWSLDPGTQSPTLFEPGLLPDNIHCFVIEQDQLWVGGDTIGCLNLNTRRFRQFQLQEGLTSRKIESLAVAAERLFASGGFFQVYQLDAGSAQWQALRRPLGRLSTGAANGCLVAGNSRCLGYLAGSALLYDIATSVWTNLEEMPLTRCLAADDAGFWYGGREGLQRYELDTRSFKSWRAPVSIRGLDVFSAGLNQYHGGSQVTEGTVTGASTSIQHFLKGLQKERARVHAQGNKSVTDPLHLDWRIPDDVTALAPDGDFLWVGASMFSGNRLLLIHKPSLSLVGGCSVMGEISSLAVSDEHLWVGAAYRGPLLTRIDKKALLSTPRSQWRSLAISSDDRLRLIRGMGARDQAMYAFYAGDDAAVAQVLGNVNPEKASVEEMLVLEFAYDPWGLDRPDLARAWSERISSRYPDSPWASAAQELLSSSAEAHKLKQRQASLLARYDANHDGVLDEAERRAMERDPDYQREEKAVQSDELDQQLQAILKKYDRNGDGRLDREELELIQNAVRMYSGVPAQMLKNHKILVAPLLSRNFPSVQSILTKYDKDQRGGLDAAGLKALASDIQKQR